MANTKEQQLQAFALRAARVSRALWPTNVRRAIATGRMAQTRRRLIVTKLPLRAPSNPKNVGRREGTSSFLIGVIALELAGASIAILVSLHFWLLLIFFILAFVAIFFLIVIMRLRISPAKSSEWGAGRRSFPSVPRKTRFPDTPMPPEPPLVRVLETFDLSQTGVEHFLDLPERGNTGGYSLTSRKEAQTSLPRTTRE